MKGHKIDHFIRSVPVKDSKRWFDRGEFLGPTVFLWLSGLVCITVGLILWINWWLMLGVAPGLICLVLVVLSETHETTSLSSLERELYVAFRALPDRQKKHLPKLTVEQIQNMSDEQRRTVRNQVLYLQRAEDALAAKEKELDPKVKNLMEALQVQIEVTQDQTTIVEQIKKEFG